MQISTEACLKGCEQLGRQHVVRPDPVQRRGKGVACDALRGLGCWQSPGLPSLACCSRKQTQVGLPMLHWVLDKKCPAGCRHTYQDNGQ